MYGAIIGDLAGSIFEYEQTKEIKNNKIEKLINEHSFYSDDTIETIAILDAIENRGDYYEYLKLYIKEYEKYLPHFKPYFDTIFSPNTINWLKNNENGNSIGNGAMMRISPVGFMFNSEEEVITNAKKATLPTHNSYESIECATIIALIIFYLRKGLTREEIYKRLNISVQYKPFKKFNKTCYETIDNCLYILYNSSDFESAIKISVYIGGDTDTNAAIVGSMAEAAFGIDKKLIKKANEKIPKKFVKVLQRYYN